MATYTEYVPQNSGVGTEHPVRVVSTASLNSIQSPTITYRVQRALHPVLSKVQTEAIAYASQSHACKVKETDGTVWRVGFLLGDGTGVGKGRTIAGIIYENFAAGRRKCLWLSAATQLVHDAKRDLSDVGAECSIKLLNEFTYDDRIPAEAEIIFLSYSTLVAKTKCTTRRFHTRLDQILDWCGTNFVGILILDEFHKAKNCTSSKIGCATVTLQTKLPLARVLYASATAASDIKHFGYMVRLGLCGFHTAFKDFEEFRKNVQNRGIGALEINAIDMKGRGVYVACQLSYADVTFSIEKVEVDDDFVELYNDAVDVWNLVFEHFTRAYAVLGYSRKLDVWRKIWGVHQMFFKSMITSAKVKRTVELCREGVNAGMCVVIGLQSTGEARIHERMKINGDSSLGSGSNAHEILKSFVEHNFPIQSTSDNYETEDECTSVKSEESQSPRTDQIATELTELKTELLERIDEIGARLPQNTLDKLICELGGHEKVAELTGRTGSVTKNSNGNFIYERRSESGVSSINAEEAKRFNDGTKLIAVVSDAASTGISLHSDRRITNQMKRMHITLELPWSADRLIQQLGRTHRSNQLNAPTYVLLVSTIAGEHRFAGDLAQKLAALGATTKGDRQATVIPAIENFMFENKFGNSAVADTVSEVFARRTYDQTRRNSTFFPEARNALSNVGVKPNANGSAIDIPVPRFLNRLMGTPLPLQNELFSLFVKNYEGIVQKARADNEWNVHVLDVETMGQLVDFNTIKCFQTHSTGSFSCNIHTFTFINGTNSNKLTLVSGCVMTAWKTLMTHVKKYNSLQLFQAKIDDGIVIGVAAERSTEFTKNLLENIEYIK